MNRDTKIQKLREAIAAQTVAYPTISQAEAIYDAVFEGYWEYGWRSFFDNGEEYEWLNVSSREDAEAQVRNLQKDEDAQNPGDGHLTYSVWRRRVLPSGEWERIS